MSYREQFEGQGLPKTRVASLYLTKGYTVHKNNSSLRHQISLILVISPLITATSDVIIPMLVSPCLCLQVQPFAMQWILAVHFTGRKMQNVHQKWKKKISHLVDSVLWYIATTISALFFFNSNFNFTRQKNQTSNNTVKVVLYY